MLKSTVNVCVVNPDYYRSSGVTVAIKNIYLSTINLGVESFFVDCGCNDELQDISWIPQKRYFKFNLMTLNPFRLIVNLIKFYRWAKREEIGVIHVHHRRLAIIFSIFLSFQKISYVYSANLTYKFNFLFWLFSPKNVIAVTKSVQENVINTTRARYIEIIGNPTKFSLNMLNNRDLANPKTAICVARLDPVKGHSFLIEAWYALKNRGLNYRLYLVGEGELRHQLESKVKVLGLESLVTFCGYSSDVKSLYEKSLFSILVSKVEGQGIVTIESAAAGRASLLTDVDGSRDCLPPCRCLPNGIPYGDSSILASTIEYWFSCPMAVLDEGEIFLTYHKELNSFEAISEKYCHIYRRIAVLGN